MPVDRTGERHGDVGFRHLLEGSGNRGGAPVRPHRHRHQEELARLSKLEQSFQVQAPIDAVWEALIDLERVAPCLPGATITGHDEDGTYHGEFKVKLGPTTASYRGTVKIEEADEATHRATMKAKGTDKRGQGGANATIVNTLTAEGGTTRVEAVTDFTITGRLARFGRGGMIEEHLQPPHARLLDLPPEPDRDHSCAERRGGGHRRGGSRGRRRRRSPAHAPPAPVPPPPPPAPAKPMSGFSLFFGALWDRIGRLFGRGRRSG